jgi:hypothetical protein
LDTYNDADRARIRAVLLDYAAENKLSVEGLFKRLCAAERGSENVPFSFRTFQRFLAGSRETRPETVAVCARFAKTLPGQRLETHRVADCLREFYNREPDAISGVYSVKTADSPLSELTIWHPINTRLSYIVTERSAGKLARLYDGALVFTGTGIMALLKDRLIRTARVHMLHLNREKQSFYGLVYDDGPLARGALPYQLLQTTLERIGHAE